MTPNKCSNNQKRFHVFLWLFVLLWNPKTKSNFAPSSFSLLNRQKMGCFSLSGSPSVPSFASSATSKETVNLNLSKAKPRKADECAENDGE